MHFRIATFPPFSQACGAILAAALQGAFTGHREYKFPVCPEVAAPLPWRPSHSYTYCSVVGEVGNFMKKWGLLGHFHPIPWYQQDAG